MYPKVFNFVDFIKLNESDNLESNGYSIPGVFQTDGGGYEINVTDSKIKDQLDGKIIINKKDSDLVELEFINGDGTRSKKISIPMEDIEIIENESSEITKIKISPYKEWINSEENLAKLEDFIEDFASEIELQKSNYYNDLIKKDLEIILDALDISLQIQEVKELGDSTWEAKLNNGSIIELKKRSDEDLIGSIKIYKDHKDHLPSINLNHENKKTTFFLRDKDNLTIEEPIHFSNLTENDPYYRYLLKRCLNMRDKKDGENLLDYFKSKISNHSKSDRDSSEDSVKKSWLEAESHIKKISKLLSDFMSHREIEELYRTESN